MKIKTQIMTIAVGLLLPVAAGAAGLEEQWSRAAAFETSLGAAMGGEYPVAPPLARPIPSPVSMPRLIPDVFWVHPECRIVDARFYRALSLKEAVDALRPCLEKVSGRYEVPLSVGVGLLPPFELPRPNIGIRIQVQASESSSVVADLRRALSSRQNSLLGHSAGVVAVGVIRPRKVSSLQAVMDRCLLPMVIAPIRNAEDFVSTFGPCLRSDQNLQIISLQPDREESLVVHLHSRAWTEVEGMNGIVRAPGSDSPVSIQIKAYPDRWGGPHKQP